MKEYMNPKIDIVEADAKEIITTSPGTETPTYDETDGIWDLSIGAEQ